MATTPKYIRRHERKAEKVFRDHAPTKAHRRIRGHSIKQLKRHRSPIQVYVLIGRKVVQAKFFHWAIWFEYASNRVLKQDNLPGGVRVSTVFLGLNHGLPWEKVPQVFETMIFGGDHANYQKRYATWDEAMKGHKEAIELTFEVSQ